MIYVDRWFFWFQQLHDIGPEMWESRSLLDTFIKAFEFYLDWYDENKA